MVLMFVFATFGVHLLGGKLWRCNDPEIGKDKVFYSDNMSSVTTYEPPHQKNNNLHMRKQKSRSASQ